MTTQSRLEKHSFASWPKKSWSDLPLVRKLRDFVSAPSEPAELVQAQCAALSRLMPPMYFILLANTWVLAANFADTAPYWLTVYCPLLLTVICDLDAETLFARADMALYAAKAAGKGTYRIFSPQLEKRIQDRVRLESKLRVALEQKSGLFVFYEALDSRGPEASARSLRNSR